MHNALAQTQQTHLGLMLRAYRAAQRLTLRDLERMTRVDHVTLARIEQGSGCELMTWLRLQYWLLSPANAGLTESGCASAQGEQWGASPEHDILAQPSSEGVKA